MSVTIDMHATVSNGGLGKSFFGRGQEIPKNASALHIIFIIILVSFANRDKDNNNNNNSNRRGPVTTTLLKAWTPAVE